MNRQRLEDNAEELERALRLVRNLAANPELKADTGRGLADIVSRYAQTFLLLQRYDEGLLSAPIVAAGGRLPTLTEARRALAALKADLIARGEATELFARESRDAFVTLLGNLEQSAFGEPAYPSIGVNRRSRRRDGCLFLCFLSFGQANERESRISAKPKLNGAQIEETKRLQFDICSELKMR